MKRLEQKPTDWICADCGNEQREFGNCTKCGSIRTAIRSVVEKVVGPNWSKLGGFKEAKHN